MTEGARNAVLTNIVVVSLALLLSCCSSYRPVDDLESTELDRNEFACDNMVSIPAPNQSMTA